MENFSIRIENNRGYITTKYSEELYNNVIQDLNEEMAKLKFTKMTIGEFCKKYDLYNYDLLRRYEGRLFIYSIFISSGLQNIKMEIIFDYLNPKKKEIMEIE